MRKTWMLLGFAAALVGDWFLAIRGSGRATPGFLCGVAAFSLAQVFWTAGQLREARPDWRVFLALAPPLAIFSGVRLAPLLPAATGVAVCAYAVLTALSFSVACATRRAFYALGIWLLLVSDLFIGGRLLGAPACGSMVGPVYVAAELCLLASFFMRGERRFELPRRNVWPWAAIFGAAAMLLFLLAAACFPGGGYNPFMRMLSALGRTTVRGVQYPLCHFLFMGGLSCAVLATANVWAHLVRHRGGGWRAAALQAGAAMNIAGLLSIMLVPENVNVNFHNVGCHLAAIGGAGVLLARDRPGADRAWTCLLVSIVGVFCVFLALHGMKVLPFAPWVPSTQKTLIGSFAIWTGSIAWRERSAPMGMWQRAALSLVVALVATVAVLQARGASCFRLAARDAGPRPSAKADSAGRWKQRALDRDEQAVFRWIAHVTGPLPAVEEKEWWNIGGTQHGLFAKRYNIAFCGYAAAMLGMCGGAEERAETGRILRNCIERYLKRDVWSYSMSKSYWGRKPWAPDPCWRENVMYTGHLLQLLALYELFTGDKRYWKEGFDFVWDFRKRVHYDVKKLIGTTVHQMRNGPNGGVTCEPGLMFFPCNNHPHIALAIFSRLGHGDWTKDARRWEKWALEHYLDPLLGGGALNLVYHVGSGIFYPRGHPGLDGWSLLWYEPWASDAERVKALWRKAAEKIDWVALETGPDERAGGFSCCDPVDVPPTPTASFLAAAARACGDDATAKRLEGLLERHVVRKDGYLFLDVGRDWRIGATANYAISMAEANGSRFRDLVR